MIESLTDGQLIALAIIFASLIIAWAIVSLTNQVLRQLKRAEIIAKNLITIRKIMRENQRENREHITYLGDSIEAVAGTKRGAPTRKPEAVAPTFGRVTTKI